MKICKSCTREFKPSSRHKDCPACRRKKKKTSCVDCGTLCQHESSRCVRCNNKGMFGEKNGNWKGGRYKNYRGYARAKMPEHPRADKCGYVFEHIIVMEAILGRHLVDGETVHHLNGVKDDNRPGNLELWIKPQPTGIRASDAVIWAQEVLELYAPELLNGCNTVAFEDGGHEGSNPSGSTRYLH